MTKQVCKVIWQNATSPMISPMIPSNVSLPLGDLDPHQIYASLDLCKSAPPPPKSISVSSAISQSSPMCPTHRHRQTDTQTTLLATSVATGCR